MTTAEMEIDHPGYQGSIVHGVITWEDKLDHGPKFLELDQKQTKIAKIEDKDEKARAQIVHSFDLLKTVFPIAKDKITAIDITDKERDRKYTSWSELNNDPAAHTLLTVICTKFIKAMKPGN